MNSLYKISFIFVLCAIITSCSDFIDVDAPKTQIVSETVFQTEASASSAIRGIYSLMMTNTSFTRGGLEEYIGIASDELISYSASANRLQFYQNSITSINGDVLTVFWGEAYKYISNANVIIEGLENSSIPDMEKKRLLGEVLFIRAFCYFYLANLFGDVPYLTESDYETNARASRVAYSTVMMNIQQDLEAAQEMLPGDLAAGMGERIRPNRHAATALLARVYLYRQEWEKAEFASTQLIDNTEMYSLQADLSQVFVANSNEAIWQLKPVVPNSGAPQASIFVLTAAPNGFSRRVSLRSEVMNSFEANDQRKAFWTKTFSNTSGAWNYINKYTTTNAPVEYSMIFRIAEQYLIRAEARAEQDNFEGAREDINAIRNRAGLDAISYNTKSELLDAVLQERRVELFGEGGQRWFDLKRTGRIDIVMSAIKTQWQPTDALLPIPHAERLINTNLTQNQGY
jgi:hypothetical protein